VTHALQSQPHQSSLCKKDSDTSVYKLAEAVSNLYPAALPPSRVWGYGRPLWDPSARVHGQRPLRVLMLGPPGAGKTTHAQLLAERFNVPIVRVGDLLRDEIARDSQLGSQARAIVESGQLVPDRCVCSQRKMTS
jgi:hypothetical protein